jgi:hypothetical protein
MSINPEVDQIVTTDDRHDPIEPVVPELPPGPNGAPALEQPAGTTVPATEIAALPAAPEAAPEKPTRVRTRPKWAVPAAIAAVGVISSATLGCLLYSTSSRLDAASQQLRLTQASLDTTKLQLLSLQADEYSKKVTADYLSQYVVDSGKVRTDYQQIVGCQTYSVCRSAAQQDLGDMQAFQSDRQSANVPAALSSSDGELGDSLSAGISAVQEMIDGMDNNSNTKTDDGYAKLGAAMLSMAKAEAALGAEIR